MILSTVPKQSSVYECQLFQDISKLVHVCGMGGSALPVCFMLQLLNFPVQKEERRTPDLATVRKMTAHLPKNSYSTKEEEPVNSVDVN